METNKNGLELGVRNRSRVQRKGSNLLKGDGDGRDSRDSKKGVPKHGADTRVNNVVRDMATTKGTTFILSPKSGPSAPVVRYSTDMRKGKGKRFPGSKQMPSNHVANLNITGGLIENSTSLQGNKASETIGRTLITDFVIDFSLCKVPGPINVITSNEIRVSVTNGSNTRGIIHLAIKVYQDNVEPIINVIDLQIACENCLGHYVGNPDARSNRQAQEVCSLSRHSDTPNGFEKVLEESHSRDLCKGAGELYFRRAGLHD